MGIFSRKTKRSYTLEKYAKSHGRSFEFKDEYGLIKYFGDFKLFKAGHSRRISHIQRISNSEYGDHGVFDYAYVVSAGNTHVPFRQTVYFRINRQLSLPHFNMFPEKWYHQVSKWFGMQDINFMEYPTFSKNYLLQGKQEDYIRAIFDDARLIKHFNAHRNWSIEAVGYYFVMYEVKKYQVPSTLPKFEKAGDELYNILLERSQALPLSGL